jgi:hypothetical protein
MRGKGRSKCSKKIKSLMVVVLFDDFIEMEHFSKEFYLCACASKTYMSYGLYMTSILAV